MKKTKIIATFMIFLVLTIPVFSSAQSITLKKYSGENGVDGVVKDKDTLTVEVIAKRPDGGAISDDNVWLASKNSEGNYDAEDKFDSCSQLPDGKNECVFSIESDALSDDYQVQLRDENNALYPDEDSKKEFSIVTDEQGPSTEKLDSSFTEQGKLKINYKITDGAKCSGIKSVEFYIKSGKTKNSLTPPKQITGKIGECTLEGEFEVSYTPSQPFFQGQLCAKATDFFGQFDERCEPFVYDKKAPAIKEVKLKDDSGVFELNHVKDSLNVPAKIVVEVESDNDDMQEVVADLSNLGGDAKQSLNKINEKEFSVNFIITKTDSCSYKVKATDKSGNSAAKDFQCTLALDTIPPTVKEISTIPEVLGKEGSINVIFEDLDDEGREGIGISEGNVQITVTDIITNRKEPKECSKSGNSEWRCDWVVAVLADTPSGEKEVTVFAKDNLGNNIEEYKGKITIDIVSPTELTAAYEVVGGAIKQEIPFPIVGDLIKFTLKGQDVNSAIADFRTLGGEKETKARNCGKNSCEFSQEVKQGTTSGEKKINFIAFDKSGNKKTLDNFLVKIYGTTSEGKPEKTGFWNVKEVKCMPSKIDRKTLAQMDGYPVYCKVELQSDDTSAEVASVSVRKQDCTGDFFKNNVKSVEVIQNSKEPYLAFALEPKEFNEDSTAEITCPLKISTLKNQKVFIDKSTKGTYFETESVQALLSFHGDSLKDIYSKMDEEIKEAVERTESSWYKISALKDLLEWFEKLCSLKSILASIGMVLQVIQAAFTKVEEGAVNPLTKAVAYTGRFGSCNAGNIYQEAYDTSIFPVLDKFCSAVSCRSFQGWGWETVAGGGTLAPWCKNIDKLFDSPALRNMLNTAELKQSDNIQLFNIKESAILSAICLCPAGIVHNLEKARQVECRYATCLIEDVKEHGVPPDECKQMKSEMICAYVIGEVWNLIPYTQIIDKLGNLVTQLLTDPIKIFSTIIGSSCLCSVIGAEIPLRCRLFAVISTTGEAAASIRDINKQKGIWSKVQNDYCEKLDKISGPYKEEKKEESEE